MKTATKNLVTLEEAFGSEIEDGGKWRLICERHFCIVQFTNKRVAQSFKNCPNEWCEACEDDSKYCYTCEITVPDHWFGTSEIVEGGVHRHESHEIGGRN